MVQPHIPELMMFAKFVHASDTLSPVPNFINLMLFCMFWRVSFSACPLYFSPLSLRLVQLTSDQYTDVSPDRKRKVKKEDQCNLILVSKIYTLKSSSKRALLFETVFFQKRDPQRHSEIILQNSNYANALNKTSIYFNLLCYMMNFLYCIHYLLYIYLAIVWNSSTDYLQTSPFYKNITAIFMLSTHAGWRPAE